MKRLLYRLRCLWHRLLGKAQPCAVRFVDEELPAELVSNTLYVVVEDGYQWHASMLCPGGCGKVLHMNLLADERPCWSLTAHIDATATLHPSIWSRTACGCHFWLRRGEVRWCPSAIGLDAARGRVDERA